MTRVHQNRADLSRGAILAVRTRISSRRAEVFASLSVRFLRRRHRGRFFFSLSLFFFVGVPRVAERKRVSVLLVVASGPMARRGFYLRAN